MRTVTGSHLTVECYDANVWLQERNLIRVTANDSRIKTIQLKEGHHTAQVVATYTLDVRSQVVIDATEILRRGGDWDIGMGLATLYIIDPLDGSYIQLSASVAGLIRPNAGFIPKRETDAIIEPPSVMLASIDTLLPIEQRVTGLQFECYADVFSEIHRYTDTGRDIPAYVSGGGLEFFDADHSVVNIKYLTTKRGYEPKAKNVRILRLDCDKNYAAVRWVSAAGVKKIHTFEVVKRKSETAEQYELLTYDGSYNVTKGRKDGLTLKLDGLNNYDMWYYSDVCHSSFVEVSLDGLEWQRVNVTTKAISFPDGNAGKLNTLLVELNYKKYDAFSL